MLKKVDLFGFSFISAPNINIIADDIFKKILYTEDNKAPFLITPNVDILVQLSKPEHKELKDALINSLYILPDGQPIVLGSKLLGKSLQARLSGSDLFPVLWEKTKSSDAKILALTTSQQVSELLSRENRNVICYTLPFFQFNDNDSINYITQECATIIMENDIKFVFIGISFPKQNILSISIHKMLVKNKFDKMPLFATLGASFEFYLNLKKRAPLFLQKIGLEWLFRFFKEPKRLFRRYFIEAPRFILILIKEIKTR
ncbi:WecB/TagA/CpsF family glycosyltransferase [Mucilaginibacter corticis]|uniref:WecB/TagA/CpsF family glycosyltransferase n=1 Tax=Mucilaginibacter corticis TaxID=2597670 RepID=A0A556MKF4_9SPHI|nr:WecB/TagA/CpsF family glycosyltransferase [Mucilaginibacter corticis]TSJ40305.1 WecB/TagA/CpsF family glycosyltransferase [Mucilaginibacter corticis]